MGMLEDALREYAAFVDRIDDPGTPASDVGLIYMKDGKLHQIDDQGTVTDLTSGNGGGGGDGAVEHIETITLASSQDDITFTGIPNTFNALRIYGRARTTHNITVALAWLRVGDGSLDTGSNYAWVWRHFHGTSAMSDRSTGNTEAKWSRWEIPGDTATAGAFGSFEFTFESYADTGRWRTWRHRVGGWTGSEIRNNVGGGTWKNTADPIERISLYPGDSQQWVAGSEARLYGIN